MTAELDWTDWTRRVGLLVSRSLRDPGIQHLRQDCLQEGLIAVWEAVPSTEFGRPGWSNYLEAAAQRRIHRVLEYRKWYGADPARRDRDAHTHPTDYFGTEWMPSNSLNEDERLSLIVLEHTDFSGAMTPRQRQQNSRQPPEFWLRTILDGHTHPEAARIAGVNKETARKQRRWVAGVALSALRNEGDD